MCIMYAMISNIILYIAVINICGFHTVCILSTVSIVTSSVYFLLSLLSLPLYTFYSYYCCLLILSCHPLPSVTINACTVY